MLKFFFTIFIAKNFPKLMTIEGFFETCISCSENHQAYKNMIETTQGLRSNETASFCEKNDLKLSTVNH